MSSQCRALIVDDEEGIRRVLRRFLERGGWSVEEAADATQARALLGSAPSDFDLVICDLNLPDGSGLDVQRAAGASAERFVVTTGESTKGSGTLSERDAADLMARGRLLSKPFSLEDLTEMLRVVGTKAA